MMDQRPRCGPGKEKEKLQEAGGRTVGRALASPAEGPGFHPQHTPKRNKQKISKRFKLGTGEHLES